MHFRNFAASLIAALALLATVGASAAPVSYSFSLTSYGPSAAGHFSGIDANNDHMLSIGELSSFDASITGNFPGAPFTRAGVGGLNSFLFDLTTGALSFDATNGLASSDPAFSQIQTQIYDNHQGYVGAVNGGFTGGSLLKTYAVALVPNAVPAPGSLSLALTALGCLGVTALRRTARCPTRFEPQAG